MSSINIQEEGTFSLVHPGDAANKAIRSNDVFANRAITLGAALTVSSAGDTIVYTPAAGKRVRIRWLGMSSPSTNTATTLATVKWGGSSGTIYIWDMGAPGGFAHRCIREGAVNESVVVNLSASQPVRVNLDVEEF